MTYDALAPSLVQGAGLDRASFESFFVAHIRASQADGATSVQGARGRLTSYMLNKHVIERMMYHRDAHGLPSQAELHSWT
jgi:hypothetical protein